MKEQQVIPKIIKLVGFDFKFNFDRDPEKIWKLEIPSVKLVKTRFVPIEILLKTLRDDTCL